METTGIRERGEPNCPSHPGHGVVLECEECPGTLVCIGCVTSTHKGHMMRELKQSVPEKKEKVRVFITDMETKIIPALLKEIEIANKKLDKNEQCYNNEIEQFKNHGERLKVEVDRIISLGVTKLQSMLKANANILDTYKSKLEKLLSELEDKTMEYTETVASGSNVLVYDTELDIINDNKVQFPEMPQLTTADYIQCNDTERYIRKAFGKIVESKTGKPKSAYTAAPQGKNFSSANVPEIISSTSNHQSFIQAEEDEEELEHSEAVDACYASKPAGPSYPVIPPDFKLKSVSVKERHSSSVNVPRTPKQTNLNVPNLPSMSTLENSKRGSRKEGDEEEVDYEVDIDTQENYERILPPFPIKPSDFKSKSQKAPGGLRPTISIAPPEVQPVQTPNPSFKPKPKPKPKPQQGLIT